jgi:hypothetical protein
LVRILGACFISFLLIFFPQVAWAGVTATGAFNTSLPFETPPVHSIGPSLGLECNVQSGNGMLGVGWRLSLQHRRIPIDPSVPGGRWYGITQLAIPHTGHLAAIEEGIEKKLEGG